MMKANGLSDANGLRAGQKLVIPTYVYTTKAPVSAPDSNPKVAEAKSSRGTKCEAPAGKLPAPLEAPSGKARGAAEIAEAQGRRGGAARRGRCPPTTRR